MEIVESRIEDAVVLAPVGALDQEGASELERIALSVIVQGSTQLVIDLARVDDVGGHALRVLLMLDQKLRGGDGGLVLSSLDQRTREVFELSQFTGIFSIAPSPEKAVRMLPLGDPRFSTMTGLAANFLGLGSIGAGSRVARAAVERVNRREDVRRLADHALSLLEPVPAAEAALRRGAEADRVEETPDGAPALRRPPAEERAAPSGRGASILAQRLTGLVQFLTSLAQRLRSWLTGGRS